VGEVDVVFLFAVSEPGVGAFRFRQRVGEAMGLPRL
jgi:hypothetical protein